MCDCNRYMGATFGIDTARVANSLRLGVERLSPSNGTWESRDPHDFDERHIPWRISPSSRVNGEAAAAIVRSDPLRLAARPKDGGHMWVNGEWRLLNQSKLEPRGQLRSDPECGYRVLWEIVEVDEAQQRNIAEQWRR